MIITDYKKDYLDFETITIFNCAVFTMAFVIDGRYKKQKQEVDVDVSMREFEKFSKAKQEKLKLTWELEAYKLFMNDIFHDEDESKPTDFVSCKFETISECI